MTVTTLNPTEIIGAGVSIVSGIVTASSGIITFFMEMQGFYKECLHHNGKIQIQV